MAVGDQPVKRKLENGEQDRKEPEDKGEKEIVHQVEVANRSEYRVGDGLCRFFVPQFDQPGELTCSRFNRKGWGKQAYPQKTAGDQDEYAGA